MLIKKHGSCTLFYTKITFYAIDLHHLLPNMSTLVHQFGSKCHHAQFFVCTGFKCKRHDKSQRLLNDEVPGIPCFSLATLGYRGDDNLKQLKQHFRAFLSPLIVLRFLLAGPPDLRTLPLIVFNPTKKADFSCWQTLLVRLSSLANIWSHCFKRKTRRT